MSKKFLWIVLSLIALLIYLGSFAVAWSQGWAIPLYLANCVWGLIFIIQNAIYDERLNRQIRELDGLMFIFMILSVTLLFPFIVVRCLVIAILEWRE